MTVVLTGSSLTLAELLHVARDAEQVVLAGDVTARMEDARGVVDRAVERGDPVYGTTVGVGVRKRFRVDRDAGEFERRLLADHRVGQGPPAPDDVVRATMLLLANTFASCRPGVRPLLVERLSAALNGGEQPLVRTLGSACGDLAPLADLAWELFADMPLAPKEAISLLGAGAYSTALAALAVSDATRFADAAEATAALELEAFAANLSVVDRRVVELRPYAGLQAASARLRELLDGSYLWEAGAARNLHDPLSFRSLPHVHGALRDALAFAQHAVELELNASQENPVVLPEADALLPTGNFELLPLAQALDLLRLALASVLTSGCERGLKLLQAPLSGLPEGLAARPGLVTCGLSEYAFALQALTVEARLLAAPVSAEVVSTTQAEGIEDRLILAGLGARRLADQVAAGARALAIELVLAAQAVDLRGALPLGAGTARLYERVRSIVPFVGEGDPLPPDLEPLVSAVRSGSLGVLPLPDPVAGVSP
ncbi:MAG: aromatic amino acid lyase [Gaiellales bacterium]